MAASGSDSANFVEVRDEPMHRHCLHNRHAWVYRVRLAPGDTTLWHRHVEDTIYLSLAAARGHEVMPDGADVITDIPCGIAVLRPHRSEPLIHQVTNVCEDEFHLLGIEILDPLDSGISAQADGPCDLLLETPRARAWRYRAAPGVTLRGGIVVATDAARSGEDILRRGDVRWADESTGLTFADGFSGFFVGWC